jgi:uncharacterized protein
VTAAGPDQHADPAVIGRLLATAKVWAVVGLGGNPARPAWSVALWLQQHGKVIVPVHPAGRPVHGATGYARLADIGAKVDVVDLFVNSARVGGIVDEAIAAGAGAVWMQLGVVDVAAADRAAAAGLAVVIDRCPVIEAWRAHR